MSDRRKKFKNYTIKHQRVIATEELNEELNDNQNVSESFHVRTNAVPSTSTRPPNVSENRMEENMEVQEENMEVPEEQHSEIPNDNEYDDDLQYFSDLDIDEDEEVDPFFKKLSDFCLKNLADAHTNELLKILRDKIPDLPSSFSNLYDAPEVVMPRPVELNGGKYMHIGIRSNLLILELPAVPRRLIVNFSWDGVRLHKASKTQMWPLVMDIEGIDMVFLIGVFIGNKKPVNNKEYFFCLLRELNSISECRSVVKVGSNKIPTLLDVSKFLADTPARTWATGKIILFSVF